MNARTQMIVNSQAFAVINMQIDEKVARLKGACLELAYRVNQEPEYPLTVRTRTYDEGETEVAIPFNISWIDTIIEKSEMIKRLPNEIRELQNLKCRLLNDYDFTHGDDSAQVAIFGKEN